jgi:multidrug efflux pump subunit AcrB
MSSSNENRKEFGLSSLSIDQSTMVMVMMFLVFVLGLYSYTTLPKEAQPDIPIPVIVISTVYPGVSPEDVENLVTQKLEAKLNEIQDVKVMTSTSVEGYANVILEFDTSVNLDEALQKVREKVDLAKPDLPADVESPVIMEINIAQFPIMQVNVAGDYSLERLKKVAEDLQDRLESIPGVLEANLAGGLDREVYIDIDLGKMKYYNIEFKDVIEAIQFENVTIPGGNVDVGSKKFLVRIPGEYKNPDKMADIVIKSRGDSPIYLRDIAKVDFGYMERASYARLDDSPVITLSIVKRSGQNIIEATDAVKAVIAEESENFPPGTTVKVTNETATMIRETVSSLENNIISGLILVVGVILFFLGVRNSFFVGIAIPLSMLLSFIVLQALGITMNMIVLFSLILALGMLVDNAIVVVENIYRYLEDGYSRVEAAKKGTGEVALPIISGTVTTLAAFTPLMFWPGIVGEFMKYLPLTLIITLSSSLFVGLVINPVLCALFMRLDGTSADQPMTTRGKRMMLIVTGIIFLLLMAGNFLVWGMILIVSVLMYFFHTRYMQRAGLVWQQKGVPWLIEKYRSSLVVALNRSGLVIFGAIGILILSFFVFGAFNRGVEFFPEGIPPRAAYIQVETPVGTLASVTDEVIRSYEARVGSIPGINDVESVVATSGSKISGGDFAGGSSSTHLGTVVVNFRDYKYRETDTFESLEFMQREFEKLAVGANVKVEVPAEGPPTGKVINLEIVGQELDVLESLTARALATIRNHPVSAKLEGLDNDMPDKRPELVVVVDREKAATFGLSTNRVGSTVRNAINGVEVSKYRDGNDEYDIIVRLDEKYRNSLDAIGDLFVMAENGRQVPISEVATWYVADGLGGINRKDMDRVITVSADVRAGYQDNAVLAEVQEVIAPLMNEMPRGYVMRWSGQQEEQNEAQEFLTGAFLVALSLIVFTLVAQFNSLAKSFMVMTSVIMSIAGVLYGLVLFQMPFGIIMTGLGIISLAGVVVNNAIVLIDYVDLLRSRDGMNVYDALIKAGQTRLRPVLLTALTTILGLVPLAIGFNFDFIVLFSNPVAFFSDISQYIYWGGEQAEWWAPMAIAVISGLAFSTLLTLIFIPVIYFQVDRLILWYNRYAYGIDKGLNSAHDSAEKTLALPKEADILEPMLN